MQHPRVQRLASCFGIKARPDDDTMGVNAKPGIVIILGVENPKVTAYVDIAAAVSEAPREHQGATGAGEMDKGEMKAE